LRDLLEKEKHKKLGVEVEARKMYMCYIGSDARSLYSISSTNSVASLEILPFFAQLLYPISNRLVLVSNPDLVYRIPLCNARYWHVAV